MFECIDLMQYKVVSAWLVSIKILNSIEDEIIFSFACNSHWMCIEGERKRPSVLIPVWFPLTEVIGLTS